MRSEIAFNDGLLNRNGIASKAKQWVKRLLSLIDSKINAY